MFHVFPVYLLKGTSPWKYKMSNVFLIKDDVKTCEASQKLHKFFQSTEKFPLTVAYIFNSWNEAKPSTEMHTWKPALYKSLVEN